jgi:hypothetical protein
MRSGRDVRVRAGVSAVQCARAAVRRRDVPARRTVDGWLVGGPRGRAVRGVPRDGRGRRPRLSGVSSGVGEGDDRAERGGQRKDDDAPPAAERTGRCAWRGGVALVVVGLSADVGVVGQDAVGGVGVRLEAIFDGAAVCCAFSEGCAVIGRKRAGRVGVVGSHPPGWTGAPGVLFVGRCLRGGLLRKLERGGSEGGCLAGLDVRADRCDGRESFPFLAVVGTRSAPLSIASIISCEVLRGFWRL